MSVSAVVRSWFGDEGWGVLDSGSTPDGCWASFSAVATAGYRVLVVGQVVELEWEQAEQDGFAYRAVRVWPAGQDPVDVTNLQESVSEGFSCTLTITWDEDPPGTPTA